MTWKRALWGLPVLVFLATFGVFAVRHPGSVDAFASSTKGIVSGAVMAGAGLIALAVGLRVKALRAVTPLLLTAVVMGSAIYAEVPFEQTSKQNRRLVAGEVVDAGDATGTTTTATTAAPDPRAPVTSTTAARTTATTAKPAASATRHSTGTLKGINHTASGDASIIESATGEWVIRFQNFTVQGSPAPVLYIVEGEDERDPGGTNLGAFTATSGTTLDVALPAGVEPGPGWTVLIWCEKFATPIANATQRAT